MSKAYGHQRASYAFLFEIQRWELQLGSRNEGFESFDYSERSYEYLGNVDVSLSLGMGFAFAIGGHLNASFSISGFLKDFKEEFFKDNEK